MRQEAGRHENPQREAPEYLLVQADTTGMPAANRIAYDASGDHQQPERLEGEESPDVDGWNVEI